jgi:bisphosphoglycerate-independent phosphoglycerate mutase (AlkP superfamily)
LRDISPTILAMLDADEPKDMTGRDLRIPIK